MTDLVSLIQKAWDRRQTFHTKASDNDCYRIFHGYGEGLPGISIDRYGRCAIVNKKAELPIDDDELARVLQDFGVFTAGVMKTHQKIPEAPTRRVRALFGEPFGTNLKVCEDGAFYYADPASLHTNGFFLDTRLARRWLRRNAADRRVLNLFAHTGSLGVAARLGGAKEVVYVDRQLDLLKKVLISYELNGLKPDDRGLLSGDIYFHLPRAIKWGQKFSAIILDPPPVVPPPPRAPKHRPRGQDFSTLVDTCCQLLDRGAWLLCVYHDARKDHGAYDQEIVDASAGRLQPIWQAHHEEDFPEVEPNRRTRMTVFQFES